MGTTMNAFNRLGFKRGQRCAELSKRRNSEATSQSHYGNEFLHDFLLIGYTIKGNYVVF